MLATLRHRNFALLWVGGLISLIGDRALMTALPFYVYQQTGSTLGTAALYFAFYLPPVLLGSVAGVFVDRWDRRRLMVVTNLIQGVVMLFLLLVRSNDWLWLIYVVFFVETTVSTFFQPAESALLPQLVDERHLVSANALNALNNNIARLAGPPIGGLLLGFFGLSSIAIVDSASFLIAAVLIALITMPSQPSRGEAPVAEEAASAWTSVWREWKAGLALVQRDRVIGMLFAIAGITSLGGVMFDPLIAPWVRSVLHGSAVELGWLSTAGAIGGLLGGLLLGRFGRTLKPGPLFGFSCVVAGFMLLVMYNLTSLPVILALALLKSVPLVGSGVGLDTLFQTGVPDRYRGRVYGAVFTTNSLLGLVSLSLAGFLGETVGIVPMLSLASGITIFAGFLALTLLPKHDLQREPAEEIDQAASITS
jgi:MFS family permease